jgi:hypothetical protein
LSGLRVKTRRLLNRVKRTREVDTYKTLTCYNKVIKKTQRSSWNGEGTARLMKVMEKIGD